MRPKRKTLPPKADAALPAAIPEESPKGTDRRTPPGTPSEPTSRPPEPESERIRRGLGRTRRGFVARLSDIFRGHPQVDEQLKNDVEEILLTADIGARTAENLLTRVTEVLDRQEVADPDVVWSAIRAYALEILEVEAPPLLYDVEPLPHVTLMIGVNGVGKTTTLGKLAARHAAQGRKVLLVAGDTFRAAASEQLEIWAERSGVDIHRGKPGADPSAVIFDGIQRGRDDGYDVVLCDTAGRLHTRKELMAELEKIRRTANKALSRGRDPVDVHDTFLVLDATIGQNALAQAALFKESMDISGLVLTKLDGTAKGGVVLGVCHELTVPIRYIGIGEAVSDLREFDAAAFCDALFSPSDTSPSRPA